MKYLDLTLDTPAANLACDEALLDWCEETGAEEVLRFWEPTEYFVVVGYANRVEREVNVSACRAKGVPIFRRCSGGGTVLQGPGCLNYNLVLRIGDDERLASITGTNRLIMERHRAALEDLLGESVSVEGHTDLAASGAKFSGNSQRRKRECLVFHGTFLLDFNLALVEELLRFPSLQPAYRRNRSHLQFLRNLGIGSAAVKAALRRAWGAERLAARVPHDRIQTLQLTQYVRDEWNWKF